MIFKINKAKESYSTMSKGKFNQVLNRMKDKENIAKNKIHVMKKAKRFKDENNYQNFIKSNVSNGKLSQKDINSMIYRFEKDALRRSRTKEKLEMMNEEKITKELSDMFKPNLTKYYFNSNRLNRNSQDSHSLKHKNLSNWSLNYKHNSADSNSINKNKIRRSKEGKRNGIVFFKTISNLNNNLLFPAYS